MSSSSNHLVALKSQKVFLFCCLLTLHYLNLPFNPDGVTVAKAISLKDKFENLGARFVMVFFFLVANPSSPVEFAVSSKMSPKKRMK